MERDEEMVRSRVLERMDLTKELTDEQILEVIREEICSYANHHSMGIARRMQMQRNIFHSLRRLDVLQELLEDDTVTEIMVNGPKSIYVEREGRLFATDLKFASEERLQNVIQKIAADQNKVVNQSSPIVDTRLRDGFQSQYRPAAGGGGRCGHIDSEICQESADHGPAGGDRSTV